MTPQNIDLLRHAVACIHDARKPADIRLKCQRLMGWLSFAAWRGGHPDAEATVAALLATWLTFEQMKAGCDDLAAHITDADFVAAVSWATVGIGVHHDLTDTAQG